jgi:diguanylate cyclase (GGDEF)-like protein
VENLKKADEENVLEQLRIRSYLFILPLVIIAIGFGWTMDFFYSNIPTTLSSFLFPVLGFWLLGNLIYILQKNSFPRILELTSFSAVMGLYFIWFGNTLISNIKLGSLSGGLGEFTNWVPLFFIYVALIFDKKMALIVSMVIFITTLTIGIVIGFLHHDAFDVQTYDSLIQFYMSNAAYIFALFFLQVLKTAFIQKEEMQHLAHTDHLTNLPNRRLMEKNLQDNIKDNKEFSIILLDIDHFKLINDTYGHDVGDQVLRAFSSLIQENIRDHDMVGRWGGEEFIIIANRLGGKQAAIFTERLRKLIEATSFIHKEKVTASFGVTEFRQSERLQDVLKRADVALYLAKENGRNIVEILM